MRLLSSLTPSTDICRTSPGTCLSKRASGQSAGANSVLVAGLRKERESPLVRTFVRLSRHFSVNEPRVAGEPSWSTRAARDPHCQLAASRDLTPHCRVTAAITSDRSVHVLSLPDRRDPPRHGSPPASLDLADRSPFVSARGCNPFHPRDSVCTHLRPVRLILFVPSPPSWCSPLLPFSFIATSNHLLTPVQRYTSPSLFLFLSLLSSPLSSPFPPSLLRCAMS